MGFAFPCWDSRLLQLETPQIRWGLSSPKRRACVRTWQRRRLGGIAGDEIMISPTAPVSPESMCDCTVYVGCADVFMYESPIIVRVKVRRCVWGVTNVFHGMSTSGPHDLPCPRLPSCFQNRSNVFRKHAIECC